jgi:hypothetical protein
MPEKEMAEKKQFKLSREMGEAALVNVARKAVVEGVWIYQDGLFKDISKDQDQTKATFVVKPPKKESFTVYHIHPSAESAPGGFLDVLEGFKVSYPSLEDFQMYLKLREKFGDLLTTKVADGWGIWTFALTKEGLDEKIYEDFEEKALYEWLKDAYIRTRLYSLRQTFDQRQKFIKLLQAHGLNIRYDTLYELQSKVMPE